MSSNIYCMQRYLMSGARVLNILSTTLIQKVFYVNGKLAAQHSIDTYIIRYLQEALINEKKRRKRGKKLNLYGEDTYADAVFWFSIKI